LDRELWKLGVLAKTEHNEVAPAQHEIAPIFTDTNTATDHNQSTMEILKNVAERHGMKCLLHEKPFAGVNGSGKHNNWSIATDTGVNLLEPGKSPYENAQFLLFLCSVIKAVDEYQDLLRLSIASAGNDHRLGSNEAPPAIISIFLGDELTEILEAIDSGSRYSNKENSDMEIGVHVLPHFPKDTTDRNRTSPFAFTGNKFEFRMLGSSLSISGPNIILNTIIAEQLQQFADNLENAKDFTSALNTLIRKTIHEHKRIIFNGNGYDDAWVKEAEKRGLLNIKTTPEAIATFIEDKNIELFTKHRIFTKEEIYSRSDILYENYIKTVSIEAQTMAEMAKKDIIPSILKYEEHLARLVAVKQDSLGINPDPEKAILKRLSELCANVYGTTESLTEKLCEAKSITDKKERSFFYKDTVISAMQTLREAADEAETLTGREYLPFPTYGDLLFSV
ncbi:MAG: glutamine synthetase type III, partial [Clostridia bacterium]|nr:glutamine synthetase type III [Clostridia bacterium]